MHKFVRPVVASLSFLLLASVVGCNREDAEALARIGHKIAAYTRSSADEMSTNLDLPWKADRKAPALQEKIHDRLRWDNLLTECALQVHVKDKEVELKGSVKTAQQRQHAIELVQTVA